jgi:hypothetical protein
MVTVEQQIYGAAGQFLRLRMDYKGEYIIVAVRAKSGWQAKVRRRDGQKLHAADKQLDTFTTEGPDYLRPEHAMQAIEKLIESGALK